MLRLIAVAGVMVGVTTLAACSAPDQPGQLTAEQDTRLNHAAEMLDANSVAFEDEGDNVTGRGDDGTTENEQ